MKKKLTILTAIAVAASVVLATPSVHAAAANLTNDEAAIIAHLPNGVTIATATAEQIATATAATITTAPKLPANRAITAAFSLTDAGAGPGVYNGDARDADVFILEAVASAQVKSATNVTAAVTAAFAAIQNTATSSKLSPSSNITGTTTDDASVASALIASTIAGIETSTVKGATDAKKTAAIKAAVKAAVKGSVVITEGIQGVVTGAVALTQATQSSLSTATKAQTKANLSLISAIVSAAVGKAKTQAVDIAQAAAEAGAYVFGDTTGTTAYGISGSVLSNYAAAIANAVKTAVGNKTFKEISADVTSAISTGASNAVAILNNTGSSYGVGAAGVLNYAFNTTTASGTPITDITGL